MARLSFAIAALLTMTISAAADTSTAPVYNPAPALPPSSANVLGLTTLLAAPLVPLSEGEQIIGIFEAAPIIRVPLQARPAPAPVVKRAPPPRQVSRVTGKPRNTTGWTGRIGAPAAVACFPRGACRNLN